MTRRFVSSLPLFQILMRANAFAVGQATGAYLHTIIQTMNKFMYTKKQPITVAGRSKGHSNTRIVSSNPTRDMDVCVFILSLLLFCVYVAALRRADPPSTESYRLCIGLRN
jgi:hypothetical protein